MNRTQIINFMINRFNYKKYLEIGVSDTNLNFNHILVQYKIGVDPQKSVTGIQYNITSDEYFQINQEKFDIIFIDGMHEYHQVYRDLQNSLKILNEGGTIILHDCNPINEVIQMVPETSDGKWTDQEWEEFVRMRNQLTDDGNWSGDCWKAIVKFRSETTEYETHVIDTDFGVGIVRKNQHSVSPITIDSELTYNNLEKNRNVWLNLITPEQFINLYQ